MGWLIPVSTQCLPFRSSPGSVVFFFAVAYLIRLTPRAAQRQLCRPARLVERAPDAPYLPSTERFEAQVQATLETAFGYTGIVDIRCTDLRGTCLIDFDDAPTEVVSVTSKNGGTYVGPLRSK